MKGAFAAGWMTATVLAFQAWAAPGGAQRLHAFETRLEANPSATAVLQDWCDTHGPKGARITARQTRGMVAPLPPEGRNALHPRPGETLRYRRVQLMCADLVLSNAENWYLPDKLTDDMNRTLDRSETPFGRVVSALNFSRHNLETRYLSAAKDRGVLRHSAVLVTDKGEAFSFVVETYTKAILSN